MSSFNEAGLWDRTMLLYNCALKEIGTKLEVLNEEFKLKNQYNPIEHITSRIKSPQSIAKKMRHNGRELTIENIVKYINDIAGIRIICSFTSDIYRIADLIAKQNDITVLKVKDYIMNPKENGYTSYHMIVSVPIFLAEKPIDTKVEIQIRTIAMDFWASLEHKMYYKFDGKAPDHIKRELRECADIVSFLDRKMLAINDEIQTYKKDDQEYPQYLADAFIDKLHDYYGSVFDEASGRVYSAKTMDSGGIIDSDVLESWSVQPDSESGTEQEQKTGQDLKAYDDQTALDKKHHDDMISAMQEKIAAKSINITGKSHPAD